MNRHIAFCMLATVSVYVSQQCPYMCPHVGHAALNEQTHCICMVATVSVYMSQQCPYTCLKCVGVLTRALCMLALSYCRYVSLYVPCVLMCPYMCPYMYACLIIPPVHAALNCGMLPLYVP